MSCRWCGPNGHNRATCANRLKYIQDNPASWEARVHRENMNAGNNRRAAKCSWCNSKEHNKRTCNHLVDDIIALTKKNANYRKHLLEFCKNKGIGIGALVKMNDIWGYSAHPKNDYGSHEEVLGLITDIDWSVFNYPEIERSNGVTVECLSVYDYGGHQKMIATFNIHPDVIAKEVGKTTATTYSSKLRFEIISPGHVMLENEPEWLKGSLPKSEFDRSVRGHRHRDHQWAFGLITHYKNF